MSDFKEFHIAGHSFAVAQITSVDTTALFDRRADFLAQMEAVAEDREYEMVLLMLTDVLLDGTWLLFVGDEEAIRNAFSAQPREGAQQRHRHGVYVFSEHLRIDNARQRLELVEHQLIVVYGYGPIRRHPLWWRHLRT